MSLELELKDIFAKFVGSNWELISKPTLALLEGNIDIEALISAITQADEECGSCGCEYDILYKRALEILRSIS